MDSFVIVSSSLITMKKSSTVESFCRRHSEQLNNSNVRYYESCVVETKPKGPLSLSYVILTSDSLLVTQSPPSSFTHSIRLAQIKDISLVADRESESLVRGGSNNNSYVSQHVRIKYESTPNVKITATNGEQGQRQRDAKRSSSTKTCLNDNYVDGNESRSNSVLDTVNEGEIDMVNIPSSIQRTFDPTWNISTSSTSRSRTLNGHLRHLHRRGLGLGLGVGLDSETDSVRTDETRSSKLTSSTESSSQSPFRSSSVVEQKLGFWRTGGADKSEQLKSKLQPRPSSVDISQLAKLRKIFRKKKPTDEAAAAVEDGGSRDYRKMKSADTGHLQELHLYFYKPGSVFLNEVYLLWNRTLLNLNQNHTTHAFDEEYKHKHNDKNKNNRQLSAEKQLNPPKTTTYSNKVGHGTDLYAAELVFQRLKNGDDKYGSGNGGIQILFKKISSRSLYKLGSESGNGGSTVPKILAGLRILHRAILKYEGLAYFCLKSSKLLTNLEVLLKNSLIIGNGRSPIAKNTEVIAVDDADGKREQKFIKYRVHRTENQEEIKNAEKFQAVLDSISTHVLLLDIFRLLLLASTEGKVAVDGKTVVGIDGGDGGTTSALISDELVHARRKFSNNNTTNADNWPAIGFNSSSQVLEVTLYSIFSFPCLLQFDHNLKSMVLDQHVDCGLELHLSRDVSKNYELIKLLSMTHNISNSILYDILIFAHFSPQDTAKKNVQILLNSFNLESFLSTSLVQLMYLFCSAQETLSFGQCTLLHRQLVVVIHLIQNSYSAHAFLRNEYCEEFRYFLNSESLNLKVPDEYPVKGKLTHACITLRNLVIK